MTSILKIFSKYITKISNSIFKILYSPLDGTLRVEEPGGGNTDEKLQSLNQSPTTPEIPDVSEENDDEKINDGEKINDDGKVNDDNKIDEEKPRESVQKTQFLNHNLVPIASSSNGIINKGNNLNYIQKNIPFIITSVGNKHIELHQHQIEDQLRVNSKTDQNAGKKKIEQSHVKQKNMKKRDSTMEHLSSSCKNINKNGN